MIPDALKVLHLKNYNHQDSDHNPLAEFRQTVTPFSPSTCSRHIHIFFDCHDFPMNNLLNFLNKNTTICDFITGESAYNFLLQWLVGAISSKLKGNDHFVLGEVRKHWTKFSKNQNISTELNQIVPLLFKDARNIRRIQFDISSGARSEALKSMCAKCTDFRHKGIQPPYDILLEEDKEKILLAQEEYYNLKIKKISQALSVLNAKASNENLSPTNFRNDSRDPFVGMFKKNLASAFEKRQVLQEIKQTLIPKMKL
jgi:hypothetical protein